jgi:hypothetical protein
VSAAKERLSEVAEAIADSDQDLLRAIGLLSVEIKPGLEIERVTLEEARDLIIEVRRSLRHGIKGALEMAGVIASNSDDTAKAAES